MSMELATMLDTRALATKPRLHQETKKEGRKGQKNSRRHHPQSRSLTRRRPRTTVNRITRPQTARVIRHEDLCAAGVTPVLFYATGADLIVI